MEDQTKVNIKMYRVGELGDCFFLSFSKSNRQSSVLIDCGSFRNGETSKMKMQEIAKNIKGQLKGEKLSVIVATHQHNDHLSGFVHAEHIFKEIMAKEAWLSWLDNQKDAQAQRMVEGERKLFFQLQQISEGLDNAVGNPFKESLVRERIDELMGFYTAVNNAPFLPAKGLENVISISNEVRFLEPGQILDLPGLDINTVKVYILGPPRNNALLFDKDPKKAETYDHKLYMVSTLARNFLSALTNFCDQGIDLEEEQFPFNNKYKSSLKSYTSLSPHYMNPKKTWQKIDDEWLIQAERLALYLDAYTNNSSLVLAFELVESGKVLLFVGDAQTGNWLSWKDIPWKEKGPRFQTSDLLANTVLYKVGHHCSHNATLVDCLEQMTHPELVAMIPVDRTDPHIKREKGWKMPATNLYRRLKEKTKNRVLLMDSGWDLDCDPDGSARESWYKLNMPKKTDLFIEYEIKG